MTHVRLRMRMGSTNPVHAFMIKVWLRLCHFHLETIGWDEDGRLDWWLGTWHLTPWGAWLHIRARKREARQLGSTGVECHIRWYRVGGRPITIRLDPRKPRSDHPTPGPW